MKIPPGFAPSRVCARSKDELLSASVMADPYFMRDDAGTAWLVAANPASALALRVEEAEEDQEGAVPVDATAAAEKHQEESWNPPLTCGEKDTIVQLSEQAPHLTLIAPRPTVLFPPILETMATAIRKSDSAQAIVFNTRLLSRLARAMGTEQVVVRTVPYGVSYWLVVEPVDPVLAGKAVGVLQPMGSVDRTGVNLAVPTMAKGAKPRPAAPASPAAGDALVCAGCGKPVHTTVSLQTAGGDPTPPMCQDCFGGALKQVSAAKKAKRGGA